MFSCQFFCRSSRWPPSKRILVLGDSLARSLHQNEDRMSDGDLKFNINFHPGATIKSLRYIIKDSFISHHVPDAVVLHIGTNSCSSHISMNCIKQQTLDLYEAAKTATGCANVFFSLVLPRWDHDNIFYRTVELNSFIKHNFPFVDASEVLLEDNFQSDGLHLNAAGAELFSRTLAAYFKKLLRPTSKEIPAYPAWWIPPLKRVKSEREKKKEAKKIEEEEVEWQKQEAKRSRRRLHWKQPGPSWGTIRSHTRRMRVNVPDGFTKIGFIDMPPSVDITPMLPTPSGCMSTPTLHHQSSLTDLPQQASPYVKRKMLGKMKVKKKRRIRKKRRRNRVRTVCAIFIQSDI